MNAHDEGQNSICRGVKPGPLLTFSPTRCQFLEAAEAFSEALDLLSEDCGAALQRQRITLLNNRSAMYEKAQCFDLALDDCDSILQAEVSHAKARPRKLRILESQERWDEALREICGMQLLFMQNNKANIRMGLPLPTPPVPSQKLEEVLAKIVPAEVEKHMQTHDERRTMPGNYTILQLLKTYSNYGDWRKKAESDGTSTSLTTKLSKAKSDKDKAVLLFKRGRRYTFERSYEKATDDYEEALKLVKKDVAMLDGCEDFNYPDLLEWVGMVRHWHFQLEPALECLREAVTLEPDRAGLLVKQAGVQLDASKPEEATKLFDQALILDPDCVDALFHRSNLRIMQGQPDQAKSDLERCLRIQPDNLMMQLRLIAILVSLQDMDGAKRRMKALDSHSGEAEVHSYRGELSFAEGDLGAALKHFEKAIEIEPSNPTPYVNAAMAILSAPMNNGQVQNTLKAVELLEQCIALDPQVAAAYIHLGQIKLGMATDLEAATEVIQLYDTALENCRMADEIKELCGMRILARSQLDAARMLNMDSFNPN